MSPELLILLVPITILLLGAVVYWKRKSIEAWFRNHQGKPNRKQKLVIWLAVIAFVLVSYAPDLPDAFRVGLGFAVVPIAMVFFVLLGGPPRARDGGSEPDQGDDRPADT